jgi:hypothetical protein
MRVLFCGDGSYTGESSNRLALAEWNGYNGTCLIGELGRCLFGAEARDVWTSCHC